MAQRIWDVGNGGEERGTKQWSWRQGKGEELRECYQSRGDGCWNVGSGGAGGGGSRRGWGGGGGGGRVALSWGGTRRERGEGEINKRNVIKKEKVWKNMKNE